MLHRIVAGFTAAVAAFAAAGVAAQQYPTRPVQIVVPFAAGGPTDTVARTVADAMTKALGSGATIVVENLGGAGGTIGAAKVAKANPDGYTLLVHHIGMATAPTLYRKLQYDPLKDFEYIGLINDVPMTLLTRNGFPAKDVKSLVSYLKANASKVTLANAGIGSASHLCGLMFMSSIGQELTTVPYKGTAPAMADLMGGQVDLLCDQTTNTTQQIRGGRVDHFAQAHRFAQRAADDGRVGLPRFFHLDLARPVRAQGHAQAGGRQAGGGAAAGAEGSGAEQAIC